MPYGGAFQTTILGRVIRFVSRGKLLKYPDELELPDEYKPQSQAVSGGGEKRERWRSPENSDRRWRGSRSMSRRPSEIRPIESRRGEEAAIDRSSSDDTVVEEEDGPSRERGEGSGEKGRDPNLVDWYSEDDQENPYVPYNFPERAKDPDTIGQRDTKPL
jgi:hypothetical protein